MANIYDIRDLGFADVKGFVDVTAGATYQGGLILCADDPDTPVNYLLAYFDRTLARVYLKKVLSGASSTVFYLDATYSAGALLEVEKFGTLVTISYNGDLIGSGTVSNAAIIDNTLHGSFKDDVSVTLENITFRSVFINGNITSTLTAKLYNDDVEISPTGDYAVGVPLQNAGFGSLIWSADDIAIILVNATINRLSVIDGDDMEMVRWSFFPDITIAVPTEYTFPWPSGGFYYLTYATVETYAVITTWNSATIYGTLVSDGGGTVSEVGVCYSEGVDPTIDGDHVVGSIDGTDITAVITGLSWHVTKYFRLYITNEAGTIYSANASFTTLWVSGGGFGGTYVELEM